MTILRVSLKTPTLAAWQFNGQRADAWPHWVQRCCAQYINNDGVPEIKHHRRSGIQILYLGEWLVCDPDGFTWFHTDAGIRQLYDVRGSP